MNNTIKLVVNDINETIKQAILHGGDLGGPYFDNMENLEKSLLRLIKSLDINDTHKIIWIDGDHYPMIVEK